MCQIVKKRFFLEKKTFDIQHLNELTSEEELSEDVAKDVSFPKPLSYER